MEKYSSLHHCVAWGKFHVLPWASISSFLLFVKKEVFYPLDVRNGMVGKGDDEWVPPVHWHDWVLCLRGSVSRDASPEHENFGPCKLVWCL